MGKTLAEKVWDEHVVRSAEGEPDLLFIDLHLIHEVTSPQAFDGLRLAGRRYAAPTSRSRPRTTTSPRSTGTSRSPTRCPVRRSRRCAGTPRSSASACTRSGTSSRASCTIVMPGWVSPSCGPTTCTMPCSRSPSGCSRTPNSSALRRSVSTWVRETGSAIGLSQSRVGTLWSSVARVRSGRRTVRPARRRPSKACGEVTSWMRWRSMKRRSGSPSARADDVLVPDLLGQGLAHDLPPPSCRVVRPCASTSTLRLHPMI